MFPQFILSEENQNKAASPLPGKKNQETAAWLHITPPEWIDTVTGPYSGLSVAFICLHDAINVGLSVDYALFQASAHLIYFREEHPHAPQENQAIHYCRFYLDDAALRLYAAGEHIANCIVNLLQIPKEKIKAGKNTSLASSVGKYLIKELPDNEVTCIIRLLALSKAWIDTINYRNEWVHDQPRLIEHPGPGVNYKRKSRWRKPWTGTWEIAIGGDSWDKPETKIEDLLSMVIDAGFALESASFEMTNILYKKLEPKIVRNLVTGELISKNLYG